jgi:hypothetical protein
VATTIGQGDAVASPAVVVGAIVGSVSYIVGDSRGDLRVDVALASMAAFLFGVFLAFTIVRTRERLALVQDLVAKGNAALLSIHQMVAVFEPGDASHIRDLIDAHLTDQIDFRLVDYYRATDSYLALIEAVYALEPMTPQQEGVYRELVMTCIATSDYRALIEAATGQALSATEWTGLIMLFCLLVALIAVLPGGTVLGAIVAGVLAGTLVTFMVLLRKLDSLRWHERVTIWEPTYRLFRSMGREPYVPREVIDKGRFRPIGRVRVVEYPDPYPLRATKIVRAIELPVIDPDRMGPLARVPDD